MLFSNKQNDWNIWLTYESYVSARSEWHVEKMVVLLFTRILHIEFYHVNWKVYSFWSFEINKDSNQWFQRRKILSQRSVHSRPLSSLLKKMNSTIRSILCKYLTTNMYFQTTKLCILYASNFPWEAFVSVIFLLIFFVKFLFEYSKNLVKNATCNFRVFVTALMREVVKMASTLF